MTAVKKTATDTVTAEHFRDELEQRMRLYLDAVKCQQVEPSRDIGRLAGEISGDHFGRAERMHVLANTRARHADELAEIEASFDRLGPADLA